MHYINDNEQGVKNGVTTPFLNAADKVKVLKFTDGFERRRFWLLMLALQCSNNGGKDLAYSLYIALSFWLYKYVYD